MKFVILKTHSQFSGHTHIYGTLKKSTLKLLNDIDLDFETVGDFRVGHVYRSSLPIIVISDMLVREGLDITCVGAATRAVSRYKNYVATTVTLSDPDDTVDSDDESKFRTRGTDPITTYDGRLGPDSTPRSKLSTADKSPFDREAEDLEQSAILDDKPKKNVSFRPKVTVIPLE